MDESDLETLQKEFPGWRYGTISPTEVSVRSGPPRRLTASKGGIFLVAETVQQLRQKLKHEVSREPGGA